MLAPLEYNALATMDTPILRYGLVMSRKLRDRDTDTDTLEQLTEQQMVFLNLRGAGMALADACKAAGIPQTMPMLWEAEADPLSVYAMCADGLKKMQAELVEDRLWQRAIKDPDALEHQRFTVKARKPEYRDNFQPQINTVAHVRVSINQQDFDTSANFKLVPDQPEPGTDGSP